MISNKNLKGYHYILDFKNVPFDICNNKDHLENIFNNIIEISKMTCLQKYSHQFHPQGITGIYLLEESHLAYHTWPENGEISFDLYTCGDKNAADKAIEELKKLIPYQNIFKFIER